MARICPSEDQAYSGKVRMAKQPRFTCSISATRSSISIPGSNDTIRVRLVFDEKTLKDIIPLVYALRGLLFRVTLYPAELDPADEDTPVFRSLGSISPSSSAIKISGKGGMTVQLDLPAAVNLMPILIQLRERDLLLLISQNGDKK